MFLPQAELAEEKRLERIKGRTRLDKLKIYSFRFVVNILVLGLLTGSIFAIIKAVGVSSNPVWFKYNVNTVSEQFQNVCFSLNHFKLFRTYCSV